MISVIMPAYNTAAYIAESIESVLQQTEQELELIIVDDGSEDNLRETIEPYLVKDKRIRFIRQDNQGVSAARTRGMDLAQGEYLAFLDGDDLWNPAFLHTAKEAIQQGNHAFVYAETEMFMADGQRSRTSAPCVSGRLDAFITSWNELRLPFHISGVLLKREILTGYAIQFERGMAISEDIGFFMKLLCVTPAVHIPAVLTYYRKREDSASTRRWTPKRWESVVHIHEGAERYVKQYAPEIWPDFVRMRDYRTYRFVWGTVKEGFIDEALQYIARWQPWLQSFVHGRGKPNDRLKCRIMLFRKAGLLRLLRLLS